MRQGTRNGLIVLAFALLAGMAAWGWMRKPSPAGQVYAAQPFVSAQGVPYDSMGRPLASVRPAYGDTQEVEGRATADPCAVPATYAMASMPMYASRNYVRTVRPRTIVAEQPTDVRYVDRGTSDRVVVRRRGRTKTKSAAIVAGSAGAGAAIGAIAGGGKGAALGAVTGGVAGFVYDRLTHRR